MLTTNLESLLAVQDAHKRLQLIAELPIATFEKSTLALLRLILQPYGKVRTAKKADLINLVSELQISYQEKVTRTLASKMTAWVDGMRITDTVLSQLLDPESINPEREQLVMHCFQGLARTTITKTELPRLRATIKHAIVNGREDLVPFLDWLYKGFSEATIAMTLTLTYKQNGKKESRSARQP